MDILTAEPTVAVLTCLNCTMMSLESSMSLNIPSSLLVNAAPHSEENSNKVTSQYAFRVKISSLSFILHRVCVVCEEVTQ